MKDEDVKREEGGPTPRRGGWSEEVVAIGWIAAVALVAGLCSRPSRLATSRLVVFAVSFVALLGLWYGGRWLWRVAWDGYQRWWFRRFQQMDPWQRKTYLQGSGREGFEIVSEGREERETDKHH